MHTWLVVNNVAKDDAVGSSWRQPRQRDVIAASFNDMEFSHNAWHLIHTIRTPVTSRDHGQ